MAAKANYIGLEKILSAFEEKADTPFFSMWWGKSKFEQNTTNDFDKAKDKIENQIKTFLEEDTNEVFIISLHPEKKVQYTFADTKDCVLMYCQAKKIDLPYNTSGNNNLNYEILEKLRSMESKINALEEDTEEDNNSISGDEDMMAKYLDKLNTFANSPLVVAGIGMFAGKHAASTALASPDQDELTKILTTLFQKGVTIDHLKKLSEFPATKIKMLLSMM